MSVDISEFGSDLLRQAAGRVRSRIDEIEQTKDRIQKGQGLLADTDERIDAYFARVSRQAEEKAHLEAGAFPREDAFKAIFNEKLIGSVDDIVSVEFLEAGLLAKRSVGRIYNDEMRSYGTGFLVGQGLVLTNHHVLPDPATASLHAFQLDFEGNKLGRPMQPFDYEFDSGRFWLTDKAHDFTLVAVQDVIGINPDLDSFGWHVLLQEQGKVLKGHPVNIIQHPKGRQKSLVVHNSHFLHLENETEDDIYCWYSGDTESGSSGAPVFNKAWEVVALHHQAVPETDADGNVLDAEGKVLTRAEIAADPGRVSYVANEGIRASRVARAIGQAALADPAMDAIRAALLDLWNRPGAWRIAQHAAKLGATPVA